MCYDFLLNHAFSEEIAKKYESAEKRQQLEIPASCSKGNVEHRARSRGGNCHLVIVLFGQCVADNFLRLSYSGEIALNCGKAEYRQGFETPASIPN
jgi:hypothetical protein